MHSQTQEASQAPSPAQAKPAAMGIKGLMKLISDEAPTAVRAGSWFPMHAAPRLSVCKPALASSAQAV